MELPSQEGPTRVRDEDEEREIKQTKQIANKVRPAQRPAWPYRQAWLCVVPAQGVFIRREQEGGRGGRELLLRASSWQCKDNELVAFNVAANEARQRSSQMSVKRRRRRNRRERGWGASKARGREEEARQSHGAKG